MPTFKPGEELSNELGGFNAQNDCGQFIDVDNPRLLVEENCSNREAFHNRRGSTQLIAGDRWIHG
jgi:hypothetical protein